MVFLRWRGSVACVRVERMRVGRGRIFEPAFTCMLYTVKVECFNLEAQLSWGEGEKERGSHAPLTVISRIGDRMICFRLQYIKSVAKDVLPFDSVDPILCAFYAGRFLL